MLDIRAFCIHSRMEQRQRLKNMDRFRTENDSILVATDVAARGLDVPEVQYVIHYNLPRSVETYVHRSGRTARASKQGLSLCLLAPEDVPTYRHFCRSLEHLGTSFPCTCETRLSVPCTRETKLSIPCARETKLSIPCTRETKLSVSRCGDSTP